jgi:hypothetical protein
MSMMFPFANSRKVTQGLLDWEVEICQQRIMILVGERDCLMDVPLMKKTAEGYRRAYRAAFGIKEMEHSESDKANDEENDKSALVASDGVRFVIVKDAGHHLQNDLQWEEGAARILDFIEQL